MSNQDKNYLHHLRHSAAHLLAAAVLELYPKALPTIGPPIEEGFYYDFDFAAELNTDKTNGDTDQRRISEDDLTKIEAKMKEVVKSWRSFKRLEVTPQAAREQFKNNPYKLELIDEFSKEGQQLTLYQAGNFIDLCRGGHIENPSQELKYFKLLSVAGAYWRGDEKNKMLTRIYGTAFPSTEELEKFLKLKEEARNRDHKKLGRELRLFTTSSLVGQGLPLFTPRGTIIRRELQNFVETLNRHYGYKQVWIPHLARPALYQTSGHWDKFQEDLFHVKGKDSQFVIKPMNCPHHTQIYASQPRSYKDLPVRFFETTTVYRDEQSGELGGLTRVRSITQDDGHTFLRPDQIEEEIERMLTIQWQVLQAVGFKDYYLRLSLRDPHNKKAYLGDDQVWEKAQNTMRAILKKKQISFQEKEGEAAFYGPKMDLLIKDSLGREWQLSTIQLDFNMPVKFKLEYTDKGGQKKTPVMIHRAFLGSLERFIGILIEHFAGALPLWLSPVQVQIIPVGTAHQAYARQLAEELSEKNIRAEIDSANETVANKIRKAERDKVPFMLVIGEKEISQDKLTIRQRGKREQKEIEKEEFIKKITKEIKERATY